ncbi:MAG: SDR family oxidoreductase [Phycisphaerae bacterium]|nr:SDR family oxidoreductase [Gemmatimonadaceae bacterium]
MDLGLANRVALVCGGSRGIGYATAEIFAREGVSVMICSRDAASVDSATAKLRAINASAAGVAADVSTAAGVEAAVTALNKQFGRADILITNTGGPIPGPALSHDWAAWEQASSLLLRSAVEMTRALVPGMQERKWGRVIGITSMAVKHPMPTLVLSNSLRAAVTGYFRTLGDEVARDGVTVNTVLPGYTETDRLAGLAEAAVKRTGSTRDAVYDGWRAVTPAGRLGRPEECGAVIAFLASEQAAFVTGQAISVDGGFGHSLL